VEFTVSDQGVGIPEKDLERIFERFYRVDPARSRETGGTGLGLSIVKHVAGNHGGDISVWSLEGQGSTFTLRLPRLKDSSMTSTGTEGAR
jgi:two-component system sensor histidine kinase SenX3